MIAAPLQYRGSWLRLYQEYMEPNLPDVSVVAQCHGWMKQYCCEAEAVFPVRFVKGAERRQVYATSDGTKIAPSDNSPAWVLHALLATGAVPSYEAFRQSIITLPAHMFDQNKYVKETMNSYGWHVAHLYPAKNGDTQFMSWDRKEVERRFFLTLHPCNLFFVPGVRSSRVGGDPAVIGFIAEQYSIRYGSIWTDFVRDICETDTLRSPGFGETPVIIDPRPVLSSKSAPNKTSDGPAFFSKHISDVSVRASYKATRLTFKRNVIEPLGPDEVFEVVTPLGVFRLTKSAFYTTFSNVVNSESYRVKGTYNYSVLPRKAQPFLTPGSMPDKPAEAMGDS